MSNCREQTPEIEPAGKSIGLLGVKTTSFGSGEMAWPLLHVTGFIPTWQSVVMVPSPSYSMKLPRSAHGTPPLAQSSSNRRRFMASFVPP